MAEKASDNKKKKTRAFEKIIKDFKENGRKPMTIKKGEPISSVVIKFLDKENNLEAPESASYKIIPLKDREDAVVTKTTNNKNVKSGQGRDDAA